MARTVADLGPGLRLSDLVSIGVLTKWIPLEAVRRVLEQTGRQSQRERNLPAQVVVYYVLALCLYMGVSYQEVYRCLLQGLDWMGLPVERLRKTGRSGISQARTRLGAEPLRRLYDELVHPIATPQTQGAFYRDQLLVSLDGSTLDLADTADNEQRYGRPGSSRGRSGFPQLRFLTLAESGTHVLFGARCAGVEVGEHTLAQEVLSHLKPGMLCLADRGFYGHMLWKRACETGANLLWRIPKNIVLPVTRHFADGSYLSQIPAPQKGPDRKLPPIPVRVIDYVLEGVDGAESMYRLITNVLDPNAGPALELAALYPERWEIESAFDELKTHLRGQRAVLRSKTPELVEQEFYGLLLTHYALRGLIHEAALKESLDPDRLSFTHTLRVAKRQLPRIVSIPPSGQEIVA